MIIARLSCQQKQDALQRRQPFGIRPLVIKAVGVLTLPVPGIAAHIGLILGSLPA